MISPAVPKIQFPMIIKKFRRFRSEEIIGSCHSLKRADNIRSWTKTALNDDYIEKVNGVKSQVLSHKNYRGHSL